MISFENIIATRKGGDYQRESFDSFLKKSKFSYSIPSIHIAGTNGKGSTATYIASIYQEAGYKVGLFTSPELVEINETIKVNGEMISDEVISKHIQNNKKLYEKYNLSSFEILTHIAFSHFENEKVDIAVIECGMGGEIDATNIFTPVLSIITSVTLEHTTFLGRSISEIAMMKGGIIKDRIPVLVGNLEEDAMTVISGIAKDKEAKLNVISLPGQVTYDNGYNFNYLTYLNCHINSKAKYSVDDACFALDAITTLKERFPVTNEQAIAGIGKVVMPARFEIIKEKPIVIVDGAHNPEAMEKLEKSLEEIFSEKQIHTVFACFRDKNLNNLLSSIGEISKDIVLTTFDHPRARTEEDYFLFVDDHSFEQDCIKAIKDMMMKYPDDVILVTGSLAFAGYIRHQFELGVFDNE